jgi:outer membrane protein assembly factor BamB
VIRRRRTALLAVVFTVVFVVVAGISDGFGMFGSGSSTTASGQTATGSGFRSHQASRPKAVPDPSNQVPINTSFAGLTTFRGNASRDYYGQGPLAVHPRILWQYPQSGGLCATSSDLFGTEQWCGTGWTGQPNVIVHKNGTIEIREGAYDDDYHFWNGMTGKPMRPDLHTGDLAKGSATSDYQGYPLYYGGSRDNSLRVIAMDGAKPTVLWSTNAHDVPHLVWNDDWDAAPLEIGDYLLEGGENSWFYVIRLHRHYDSKGLVEVNPKIVMLVPGWDAQLGQEVHDEDISIEDSVAFDRGIVYFSNGGGLVQGWDISDILRGGHHYKRVFRFWDGDDTDATIVIDPQGYLYVSRHIEENVPRPAALPRDHELGGLMKLNPRNPSHPVVWSVPVGDFSPDGGSLSTPALYKGTVYDAGTAGEVMAVNQQTGAVYWRINQHSQTWGSPVTIDNQMVLGDCRGGLHDYDISNARVPPKVLWTVKLDGCIESTPAVWHGMLWVGARGGKFYGIGDPGPNPIKR